MTTRKGSRGGRKPKEAPFRRVVITLRSDHADYLRQLGTALDCTMGAALDQLLDTLAPQLECLAIADGRLMALFEWVDDDESAPEVVA